MDTYLETQKQLINMALNEMNLNKNNISRKNIIKTLKEKLGYEPEVSFSWDIDERLNENNVKVTTEELDIKIIFGDPNNLSFMVYSV
jgi:hypothetical protein